MLILAPAALRSAAGWQSDHRNVYDFRKSAAIVPRCSQRRRRIFRMSSWWTVKPALDGALVGMAAGDRATFDRVRPLLDEMTRRLDFLGDVGNAAAMKLAINLPLMVYWGALGEAVALLGRQNVDVKQAFDILTDSSGAVGPAEARQGPIIDLIKNGQAGVSNFAIDQAIKDMNLTKSHAGQCGFECPTITAALDTATGAKDAGWDKKDISLLAAWRTRDD